MKVKIRDYSRENLNAEGTIHYQGGYMSDDTAYVYSYSVTLLVDKNTTVCLLNVKPDEIEVTQDA